MQTKLSCLVMIRIFRRCFATRILANDVVHEAVTLITRADNSVKDFKQQSLPTKNLLRLRSDLEKGLEKLDSLQKMMDDAEAAEWMGDLLRDRDELTSQIAETSQELDDVILFDNVVESNCFLDIHSGAGGDDATEWTCMLQRAYVRWCRNSALSCDVIDETPSDVGLKSCVLAVKGRRAYSRLRHEQGVHRLVRLSPFDSKHRRHTSFASVVVVPDTSSKSGAAGAFKLSPADVRVETFRASGAGGQSVNKTESAVRMTHTPTGLVAQCQNERSQIQNRASCLSLLTARVAALQAEREAQEQRALRGVVDSAQFGANVCRTYQLHPSERVVCTHSGKTGNNAKAVLDGDFDEWMRAIARTARKNAAT
jgi:peptide chain release factor 2